MQKKRAFDHSKYQLWIDPNEVVPYEKNAKIHTWENFTGQKAVKLNNE